MNKLIVTEFKDIRVLTTQQLAEEYETDDKTISNNFTRNKDRYKEGKHYILLKGEELREFKANHQFDETLKYVSILYLWTEKGCLLHAKSLGTDKAWEVYEVLVDTYFKKPSDLLDNLSTEMQALIMHDKKLQAVAEHIKDHDNKIKNLENTMNIDYGQQQVIKKLVNASVIKTLGGYESPAYKEIGKKVFSECNRDIQDYFDVNSRCNIPKIKYEDACTYIKNWLPCTNTKISINECNAQMSMV